LPGWGVRKGIRLRLPRQFLSNPVIQAWPCNCGSGTAHGGDARDTQSSTIGRDGVCVITILLVLLVLMLIGSVPTWPHSQNWGYAPSGTLSLVVLVLVVLLLTGRL
jgi:hypothetical protein